MTRLLTTTLAIVLIVGSGSSAQSGERPFQGEASGFFSDSGRTYEVFGQATHLGRCQSSLGLRHAPQLFFRRLLDIFGDDPLARSSQAFFIASDGSALLGTIRYDAFDAESLTAAAEITISGGTGRFAEAAGTIDVLFLFTNETLLECDVLMDGTLDY